MQHCMRTAYTHYFLRPFKSTLGLVWKIIIQCTVILQFYTGTSMWIFTCCFWPWLCCTSTSSSVVSCHMLSLTCSLLHLSFSLMHGEWWEVIAAVLSTCKDRPMIRSEWNWAAYEGQTIAQWQAKLISLWMKYSWMQIPWYRKMSNSNDDGLH